MTMLVPLTAVVALMLAGVLLAFVVLDRARALVAAAEKRARADRRTMRGGLAGRAGYRRWPGSRYAPDGAAGDRRAGCAKVGLESQQTGAGIEDGTGVENPARQIAAALQVPVQEVELLA